MDQDQKKETVLGTPNHTDNFVFNQSPKQF